ncbi:MAG TPA: alanine racemase [Tetragenococcus sp.]|nr:alanine racemase [Tetragenococcus sp.]
MITSYHRPTQAVINLAAVKENIEQTFRQYPDKEIFAVVKADGYGHGAVAVAKTALTAGVTGFCVATIDEAIQLRTAGLVQPILILGLIEAKDAVLAATYHISVTVAQVDWLKKAAVYLKETDSTLLVHIKVDTGMGRIGFLSENEIKQAIEFMAADDHFDWEGIFTHYATADQEDSTYFKQQEKQFSQIVSALPYRPPYVHSANSATLLWHHGCGNMLRLGISMYGLNPSAGVLSPTQELKPAFSLVSEIIQVKCLPAGSAIGYGKTYETSEDEWIATIPIGYADGYMRKMQGFYVLVEGNYCEVVGRVCMDQIMVRLPRQFAEGTKVTLIGKNKEKEITLQEYAEYAGTIHYEALCLISSRVPRQYIKKG